MMIWGEFFQTLLWSSIDYLQAHMTCLQKIDHVLGQKANVNK